MSTRRLRMKLAGLVAVATVVGGACVPQSGGGTLIPFGPVTIPLPPIGTTAPPTVIPVLFCNISYYPPSFQIVGATVTIPGILIDTSKSTVGVPNVVVSIPQTKVGLPALGLGCGPLNITTNVNLIIPATVKVQAALINLQTRQLVLSDPSFTINGVGLELPGLFGLVIPLPPITIPLSTIYVDIPQ
ncbi:MAG: hypothetical protein U0Q22_12040 [Acidimicrobiales bacterium]